MQFKVTRECGSCTACCDGRLLLDIFGKKWVGRPCHYLKKNKGCTIYKHRPDNPCKQFSCGWLKDSKYKYPEWLKPNKSGFLLMDWKKTKTGIPYTIAVAGKEGYNEESMLWLIEYCNHNNVNLELILQGSKKYIGSKEFRNCFKR
jgi:hypothetical protein